jgi:hypothetical protein
MCRSGTPNTHPDQHRGLHRRSAQIGASACARTGDRGRAGPALSPSCSDRALRAFRVLMGPRPVPAALALGLRPTRRGRPRHRTRSRRSVANRVSADRTPACRSACSRTSRGIDVSGVDVSATGRHIATRDRAITGTWKRWGSGSAGSGPVHRKPDGIQRRRVRRATRVRHR